MIHRRNRHEYRTAASTLRFCKDAIRAELGTGECCTATPDTPKPSPSVSWCVDQHAIGVITGEIGAGKTVAIRGCDNGIGSGAAHDSRIRAATPAMLHSPPRPGPSRSSARSLHSVAKHFVTIRHHGADNSGIDPTSVRDWINSGNDRLAMRATSSHTRIGVRCPVWTATQQNRTNVRYVLVGGSPTVAAAYLWVRKTAPGRARHLCPPWNKHTHINFGHVSRRYWLLPLSPLP